MNMRVFIGIKLNDCISEIKSIIENLKVEGGQANYTKLDNIHITLEFLGEISVMDIEKIKEIFSFVKQKCFEISLNKITNFKNMIILGVQNNEHLNLLQARLNESLKQRGFLLQNRKYFPHVTLARKSNIEIKKDINLICQVKEIILFSSSRINNELIYKPLFWKKLED